MNMLDSEIRELHLFAGIGGGIYGGQLLNHRCVGGVEIDEFCQKVLLQRQADKWMDPFEIYGDITTLKGGCFNGTFDILAGGFPCQAFSHAARGKNIVSKDLWCEMLRFTEESEAPIVFAENVTLRALKIARKDLEGIGYKVKLCKLSNHELGGDHRRNRYWLLAIKNNKIFKKVSKHVLALPVFDGHYWVKSPNMLGYDNECLERRKQLKAIGNAQSPIVAATAFRILTNRHVNTNIKDSVNVCESEIKAVFKLQTSWIQNEYGIDFGWVHTPTTMANYTCPSMMKHAGCRNYKVVFGKPEPQDAEYLMGFPIGASIPCSLDIENYKKWINK